MALNSWQKREEEPEHDDSLCIAHGCPNRWAVDMGSRLCSAHAWSQPHQWPKITEDQYRKTSKPLAPAQRVYTLNEKIKVLQDLRFALKQPQDMKAWAHRLKAREQAGEPLTSTQREAWRNALRSHE